MRCGAVFGLILISFSCASYFFMLKMPEVAQFHTLKQASNDLAWRPRQKDLPPLGHICGLVGGQTLVLSKKYLFLWAIYDGETVEQSLDTSVVRGCNRKITALPMAMTWPGMQPHLGGFYPAATDIQDGIRMIIRPESSGSMQVFNTVLEHLGDNALTKMEQGRTVSPGLKLAAGTTADGGLIKVYWTDFNKTRPAIFLCRWKSTGYQFYLCEGRFVLEPEGVRVDLIMSPEKIVDWRQMLDGAEHLVRSSLRPLNL